MERVGGGLGTESSAMSDGGFCSEGGSDGGFVGKLLDLCIGCRFLGFAFRVGAMFGGAIDMRGEIKSECCASIFLSASVLSGFGDSLIWCGPSGYVAAFGSLFTRKVNSDFVRCGDSSATVSGAGSVGERAANWFPAERTLSLAVCLERKPVEEDVLDHCGLTFAQL